MTTEDEIQITYRAVGSEFGEFARAGALISYGRS
jgi:hypothetical protein